MPRLRAVLTLITLAAATVPDAAAQTLARRGAVIGGTVAAGIVGVLGAVLSRGVCDAADCSDAWIDGAVPGVVLGGLAGALVGGGVGSLIETDRPGSPSMVSGSGFAVMIEGATARAEWNSIDETLYGARTIVGLRRAGLLIGPTVEWLTGNDWRVFAVGAAARLDPARGSLRPFAELSAGRYGWSNPAIIADCSPAPPDCTFAPGTVTDNYIGGAGAVGASIVDDRGRYRVFAEVRYHFAPNRPLSEPGSNTTRSTRQLAVGAEIAVGR